MLFEGCTGWKLVQLAKCIEALIIEGRNGSMKIYTEKSLGDFDFWSGAVSTVDELSMKELETIETELESLYPDGLSETEVNDIFWFEQDWIAEILGYECWEHLEAEHRGEEWGDEDEDEEEE